MTQSADKSNPDPQTRAANEERFRALVTATSDVIYSLSADWQVMRELDGRGFLKNTHEPITGWRSQNVYPDDMEMVNIAIDQAIREKKIFELEHRVLRADGSPGWTFSRAVPIINNKGEIIEWFGAASDITDRKQAEEALRKSKEQANQQKRFYETITSATPDLMYVFGLDYRFTYANSALLSMWGKTWENAVGKSLLENGYEPWHAKMHEREIDQVKVTKQSVRGEVSFPHATLGRRVYDYILTPVLNAEGEVEAVAGTTRDITERKLWEESLARSSEELQAINEEMATSNEELTTSNEELLEIQQLLQQETIEKQNAIDQLEVSEQRSRSMVAAAPFPIGVYTGREMRVLMANQAIIDVWGKGNDVIGKTYHEILPELAGQEIYQQLDHVYMTGKPFHARNQQVDILVDGRLQPFYFNYSFTPLREPDGRVYGVMNTAAEVTDLVVAKQQVEQSEENLKAMIAQAPVAMCILSGPNHVITVVNGLMIELWGKEQVLVMDKPVFDALPDARGQGLEEIMKRVYETGETFYASELPVSLIRHGRPEVVYQNFVYQAYRDAAGYIAGVIAITIDATEQVLARKTIEQSEAELREIKKQLEAELETSKEVQRQKDGFIGMASHELKTPLTSAISYVQVSQRKTLNDGDPQTADMLARAGKQLGKMTSMINGFLNVSRLESGKIHMDKQTFDIAQLMKEAEGEATAGITSHKVIFSSDVEAMVNADREKVGQVISNLISNAVKYSQPGSAIRVDCKRVDKHIQISVADDGIGIGPEDLPRLFERYYRVKANENRHIAGFGIGLYLCSEIVKGHGGTIWVESKIGEGSTFYFTLPK